MAAKPETSFSKRLHNRVSKEVYREKMANPFRGGTPDFYYEGIEGILWSEHKFWTSVPGIITPEKIVSPLQWLWIQRAHRNNIPVVTIVGYRKGGLIIRPNEQPMLGSQFKEDLMSLEDLALWIEGNTIDKTKLVYSKRSSTSRDNNNRDDKSK